MLSRSQINDEWNKCEALYQRGEWSIALDGYQKLLDELTVGIATGEYAPDGAYLLLVERVADLSVPFGVYDQVDDLLKGISEMCIDRGNEYFADYSVLKRVHVAFMQSDLPKVADLLRQMAPRIGEFTAPVCDEEGLTQWEKSCHWKNADRGGRHTLLALLCLEIGRYWAGHGKYERAAQLFARGLAHTGDKAPDLAREARIPLLVSIAETQLERGDLKAARQSLLALEAKLVPARHPAHVVRRLEMLAKLDLIEGHFGSAEDMLLETVRLCDERKFYRGSLTARLNLSHVKIFLNQTFVARRWLDAVKAAASKIGDWTIGARADLLLRLIRSSSRAYVDSHPVEMIARMRERDREQSVAGAEEEVRLSGREIKRPTSFLSYFEAHTVLFYQLLGREEIAALARLANDLEESFGDCDSDLIGARLLVLRGIAGYYEGREQTIGNRLEQAEAKYRQAEERLIEAGARLEAMGLKPELWQSQRVLAWLRTRLGGDPSALAQLRDRADDLLAELAESLPPDERVFLLIDNWTADEEALADRVVEIEGLRRELAGRRGLQALLALPLRLSMMKRIHDLLWRIDRHKGALSRKMIGGRHEPEESAPPLTLWQRLWRHPRRRATLSFLVAPNFVVAIRSGFLSLRFALSEIRRSEVRDLVREWHWNANLEGARQLIALSSQRNLLPVFGSTFDQIKEREGRNQQERERAMEEIAGIMAHALSLPDLLGDLPRDTPLTIVPDDSLHGFPFAAIRYGEERLIERFAISLAFESSPRVPAPDADCSMEALLVAMPEGGMVRTAGGPPFHARPIPDAARELDMVEKWRMAKQGGKIRRSDKYADKEWVLRHLPAAGFFHIACHGYPCPDSPDQSGLVLIPRGGEAEVLTLRELAGLKLDSLRHVTLSSCWSADNFVLPGRWVISLPETLWRSGAQSILGALWPIDDKIAAAFMARFYYYLDENPRDRALQRTQLDCLHNRLPVDETPENSKTSHLFHWAGYNLYGDYRAIASGARDRRLKALPKTDNEQPT